MRLEGKVALITGAAAGVQGELMGFGGASAWLFVREGAKVVLADIKDELGERSAAQIRENGFEAIYVHLDVTRESDWVNAISATVSNFQAGHCGQQRRYGRTTRRSGYHRGGVGRTDGSPRQGGIPGNQAGHP